MITSIYIKNFKAFKEVDLSLSNLTLFTGLNGMGKSTVIQSLLLLRQSYEKNTLLDKGLFLNGDYVEIGKGRDAYSFEGEGDRIIFQLEWDDRFEASFNFMYSPHSDLQPIVSLKLTNSFDPFEISPFNNRFQYLSAERLSPKSFFPVSTFHVEELHSLGNKGEYTAHFIALNQRESITLPKLLHPKANNPTLLTQLDAWMGEVAPGISMNAMVHGDINAAKISYKYETADEFTSDLSPLNVGFGLTYALPIFTAILAARKGDLLIIENPESHLHPSGQAIIGKLCALASDSGVQIIIESHSDHILNAIRVATKNKVIAPENTAIYFFERNLNQKGHKVDVIHPYIDENGRLSEKPKGFFDEWGKQLDQLI